MTFVRVKPTKAGYDGDRGEKAESEGGGVAFDG